MMHCSKTGSAEIRLLLTSGDGPRECRRAVMLVLQRMKKEAMGLKISLEATLAGDTDTDDHASAIIRLTGSASGQLAQRWTGTIQWTAQSPFRPHHKRKNWFVGVFELAEEDAGMEELHPADLKYEAFRAGGPGGQHQNTTDSAVRLTHLPSGLSVISRDERSQHRNRQLALARLQDRLFLERAASQARSKSSENLLHKQLERGNPVLSFKGDRFIET